MQSAAGAKTPSMLALALVPWMLNPVTYHPLLTGASLDNQAKTKISILGHFHLQASACVPADDWTILGGIKTLNLNKSAQWQQSAAIVSPGKLCVTSHWHWIYSKHVHVFLWKCPC